MRRASAQRGVALITALLVVAVATSVAVGFALRDRIEIHRAGLLQAQAQAESLARAGETLALRLLERTQNLSELPWDETCRTMWFPFEVDGLQVAARLENLHCRFNVNALSQTDPAARDAAVAAFVALLDAVIVEARDAGATDTDLALGQVNPNLLANAVVDWMNPETDDPRYRLDDPPRRSGNRRMVLAAELSRVEGFSPALLARLAPYVTARPGGDFYIDPDWAPDVVLRTVGQVEQAQRGRTRYLRLEQRIELLDREFRFCAVVDGPNGRRVLRMAGPCEA